MKIYFAGSIRGGRNDQDFYLSIIKELEKFGEVLTEHIGKKELTSKGEKSMSDEQIFERDIFYIKESDIIVAEVTNPSLGVGYEIGKAESLNKKIICLFRGIEGRQISAMIAGNKYIKIFKYSNIDDIKEILNNNL